MAQGERPLVGAAMRVERLAEFRDWLIADQRDLEIQDTYDTEMLDGDWRSVAREARTLLDGYTGRLGIHGPFIGLTILAADRRLRELVVDRFRVALEFAGEVGATHMVVHSPFLFFGANVFVTESRPNELEQKIETVHQTLEPVLAMAREIGCTLVIENILDRNPRSLLELVRSFDSELVRLSIDTGHAFITHRLGGPPPDQWARLAGPLLGHLHLADTDGNVDRHWAPGRGEINWFALFDALGELEQSPRLIIEVPDIASGAEWLAGQGLAR